MLRETLQSTIGAVVAALVREGKLPAAVADVPVEISDTKAPEHGDYACNFAMVAAKKAGMNPRALGEMIRESLGTPPLGEGQGWGGDLLAAVELAGPGFLNLRVRPEAIAATVPEILKKGTAFGLVANPNPQRINVEFVSVNPNGPITIGSGRGAAFGSTLCNVLQAAGNVVHREYYINDGVNSEQMRLFAESAKALAEGRDVPEKGYKGDYVKDVAKAVSEKHSTDGLSTADWQQKAQTLMIERQRGDLEAFGVHFDTWFSEQSLHDRGIVAGRIDGLKATGVADEAPYRTKLKLGKGGKIEETIREEQPNEAEEEEAEGAESPTPAPPQGEGSATLWLRSTLFGDDMDRVLRRRDGRLTYIASDVAYHEDKLNRPPDATKMITILGPDHHGYIGRLTAVVAALLRGPEGTPEANAQALATAKEKLEVVIYQLVRFLKDGKPAPMRKRDGNIYELRDLIDELGKALNPEGTAEERQTTGRDVARFFYLMRSHDTTMDFDIDLATQQSDENPVFYAQYAHARICSVLRKASETLPQGEATHPHPTLPQGGGTSATPPTGEGAGVGFRRRSGLRPPHPSPRTRPDQEDPRPALGGRADREGLRRPPPRDLRRRTRPHLPPLLRRLPRDPAGESRPHRRPPRPLRGHEDRPPGHLRTSGRLRARATGTTGRDSVDSGSRIPCRSDRLGVVDAPRVLSD